MSSSPFNHDSNDDPQDPSVRSGNGRKEAGSEGSKSILIPEGLLPGIPFQDALPVEAASASDEQRSAVARGHVVASWLQQLERQSAPFSLEGLVVAAMNPGQRQARATESLLGLAKLKAPSELDILVAGDILRTDPSDSWVAERAPRELDGLVEDRVLEPEAGLVRGMAQRLDAVQAPRELEARLERQLDSGIYAKPVRTRPWLRAATAGLALAACLLIVSRLGQPGMSAVTPGVGTPAPDAAPVALASGDVLTTASGLPFTVTLVDGDSMTDADRGVVRMLGLPASGGS